MKKLFTILALSLATAVAAHAQFGVIGGFTTARTNISGTDWQAEIKNAANWHAGVAYKIEIGPLFTLQPALVYQTKGSVVRDDIRTLTSKAGFVEAELGAQLGIDLLAVRPYLLLEPFIGYQVTGNEIVAAAGYDVDNLNKYLSQAKNRFEVGFGVGAGIEILRHIQVSAQWFMNVGKLYNGDKLASEAIWGIATSGYKDIKNYSGVKITVGLFF